MARPDQAWPELPYPEWSETCTALHLYTQVVGKYRLARAPWVNHSWHATLYVNAAGLTTGLVPDGAQALEVQLDLHEHALIVRSSRGGAARFALEPMTVAEFHGHFRHLIESLGGTPEFDGAPNEVVDATPFAADHRPRPYARDPMRRYHQALVRIVRVFDAFRTSFLGKVSPVHLFWGSFDLAVTRFSGRAAPPHPGGIPNLPDEVTREAYSHEVSSAGFWPGGGGPIDYPAFYSYAYPAPEGFAAAPVEPAEAFFHEALGEFVLPYEVVRASPAPERTLLAFLESTYRAAAERAEWDRARLECPRGQPGAPRPIAQR